MRSRDKLPQCVVVLLSLCLAVVPCLQGREKDGIQYGAGLIVNVPMPEDEVAQAVQEVVQNGIIRGTKEYNKDEFITGATPESVSRLFPAWTEGGKVFYKQRLHALDPRNFKDGGDVGTLTVRYVVQEQDEKSTVLRIDAVFVEDFRRTSHPSNGSVESAEYKDIHDHIEATELLKQQATEAEKEKQERANPQSAPGAQDWSSSTTSSSVPASSASEESPKGPTPASTTTLTSKISSSQTQGKSDSDQLGPLDLEPLEKRVQHLKQQVERLVKSPGAALKSAPFQTASTLKSLSSGTEVLIVISTPYWYGVETHEGQHGWIPRDELEPLP
jgi:hypothetical protein